MTKLYTLTVADDGTASLALQGPPPPPPSKLLDYHGANLEGGGSYFANWQPDGPNEAVNGGGDYLFMTHAEVDVLIAAGCNAFRLLFTWEALQPTEYAAVATLGGKYAIYRDKLYSLVDYITGKGCKVILDIHGDHDAGFAAYKNVPVGKKTPSGQPVEDLLANLWWHLGGKFLSNTLVEFGITNEPHDMDAYTWFHCAQKVINNIRATGNKTRIHMPGTGWTAASTWATTNGPFWNLTDPANNLGIQLHLYVDQWAGGGGDDIVSGTIGSERLKDAVAWARAKGLKVILGEVGINAKLNPALATACWKDLHDFMLANRDVCSGFCWWSAGPAIWWSGYRFYLGAGTPQLSLIQSALK